MAYYMAKVLKTGNTFSVKCQEHGIVSRWDDEDDACDAAAAHDTSHNYNGEDGE